MVKAFIGGAVLAALAGPAMATEYWVQYDYSTHTCSIIEKQTAGNPADTAKDGAPPNPDADATAANTPKDNPISDTPQGFAAPTQDTPPVVVSRTPANPTTPGAAPGAPAPANPAKTASPAGGPNGAPAPAAPTEAKGFDENDPFAGLAASWARKKAAAEAAGTAGITKVEIGTAMHSREEAEEEMQIMRKCGLKN